MSVLSRVLLAVAVPALWLACGGSAASTDTVTPAVENTTPLPGGKTTWWKPAAGVSFDWELDDIGASATFAGDVVDVDAFTTSAETVTALHARGKKVIAYLSVGTIEDDRGDANLLPPAVIGNVYPEWPNERWLDVRQLDALKPWLVSRFNMILAKGFDGVEPDNLDAYDNDSGFPLGVAEARAYADLLIGIAHDNGLSIGQKNVKELAADYAGKLDWALTEDAFAQGWQASLSPYVNLGKPVFAVEYTDETSAADFHAKVCPAAKTLGYTAILKPRDLGASVERCP